MNATEFNQWLDDYCEAFPETALWLEKFGEQTTPKILGRWQQAFVERRVSLIDARAVTAAMLSGKLPAIPAYEREQTPAKIATHARKIGDDRRRVAPAEVDVADAPQRPIGLGGIFDELVKAKRAGATLGDLEAIVVARFGDHSDDRRSRYRCLQCRDIGVVSVLAITTMAQLAKVAAGDPCGTASTACTCREAETWTRTDPPMVRFDPTQHVRAEGKGTRRDRAAELLEERRKAGRVADFDSYNEKEAFA